MILSSTRDQFHLHCAVRSQIALGFIGTDVGVLFTRVQGTILVLMVSNWRK